MNLISNKLIYIHADSKCWKEAGEISEWLSALCANKAS